MFPLAMAQMPASPADALTVSREYVDKADYYLGIVVFRYGTVPEGHETSNTELEYNRAIERGLPRPRLWSQRALRRRSSNHFVISAL